VQWDRECRARDLVLGGGTSSAKRSGSKPIRGNALGRSGITELLFQSSRTEHGSDMTIERIVWLDELLAIIVRHDFAGSGVQFFTPSEFSQQLGYMQHPVGKLIQPHVHAAVQREVEYTQEVLFIRKGRLRVDFYTAAQQYLESRVLEAGDVILLASAGHGFEVLQDVEMFEVKQGPYAQHADKVRFDGIRPEDAILGGSSN